MYLIIHYIFPSQNNVFFQQQQRQFINHPPHQKENTISTISPIHNPIPFHPIPLIHNNLQKILNEQTNQRTRNQNPRNSLNPLSSGENNLRPPIPNRHSNPKQHNQSSKHNFLIKRTFPKGKRALFQITIHSINTKFLRTNQIIKSSPIIFFKGNYT